MLGQHTIPGPGYNKFQATLPNSDARTIDVVSYQRLSRTEPGGRPKRGFVCTLAFEMNVAFVLLVSMITRGLCEAPRHLFAYQSSKLYLATKCLIHVARTPQGHEV